MRANEFVKKFGWIVSKFCLGNCMSPNDKWFIHEGELVCDKDFDDLKRLVESWKLVNFYGGIQNAKEIIKISARSGYGPSSLSDINQSIADVESCQ